MNRREQPCALSPAQRLRQLDAIRLGGPAAWNELRAASGERLDTLLASACFRGHCLDGIDLEAMLLPDAEFDHCNLDRANLREAQLIGASIQCAWARAMRAERVVFAESDLSNTDFTGSSLRGADLSGAALYATCLDAADLRQASFDRASIGDCSFDRTDLRSASFRGARIWRVDLSSCQLDGAQFDGAILSDAILPDDAHERLDLSNVMLKKVRFVSA
jgi:uncharacterized protein YjbI with pentapeptide repeats